MGAGKSTLGLVAAQKLGRRFIDLDRELERSMQQSIPELFEQRGEAEFRVLEREATLQALCNERPAVLALGGGAIETPSIRKTLKERALTVFLQVDPQTAWTRVGGGARPLAKDEAAFHALFGHRQPIYLEGADAVARDTDDIVLAAAGIAVEHGSFAWLSELVPEGEVEVIGDAVVLGLHRPPVDAPVHALRDGEEAKSLGAVERLWRELRLGRRGTIVALGGGCTTDAAGFAAATYMRGVRWVAVPTTLIGQVDAAIGGKTAVDLPEGKNLVGAFHWPARTLIDPTLLETLSADERLNGMAEVVKTGLLVGQPLWELPDAELVRRCAAFKSAVCLRDPHDEGPRHVLNLGHTFAHALESAAGYDLPHGRAVALGLVAALLLSGRETGAVQDVLRPERVRVDRERAWEALQRDKKGPLRVILLGDDGGFETQLPERDVRAALDELIAG